MKYLSLLVLLFSFTAFAADPAPAPSASATAVNMVTQVPAFLTQLDKTRGKALTVAEKASVTDLVKKGGDTVNGIQNQFLGTASKASGLDVATMGVLFPSATKPVDTKELTSKVEGKLGKKLGFVQKTALTSANTLRNNSLAGFKTTLSQNVGKQLGMDPVLVEGLLPLLGF